MALPRFDIQAAKPREKAYKLADGGGLYLLIQPSGRKLWRLKYRRHGAQRLLSFGPYRQVSIADARGRRDDAKRLMSEGRDPAVQKKPWIAPIPGTTKRLRFEEDIGAASPTLSADDLGAIETALAGVKAQGDRHPAHLQARVGR